MKRRLRGTFQSLENRQYRIYLTGQGISVIGTWMEKMAQAWLILELTDSGVLLGVTAALQHVPTLLLTPYAGVLADRFEKRKILLYMQSLAALPALLLGVLTLSGHVTVWMVLVLTLISGTINAIDKPARLTFAAEIVDRKHLTNAVTLNNIVQNLGKVVGPALAGILIATIGLGYSFLANAGSFVAVVIGLSIIRPEQLHPVHAKQRSRGQLIEGVRYVRTRRDLLGPLLLMTTSGLLAYNWQTVTPLLAKNTFGGDARVAGFMFTCMGLGAIFGGLAVAGSLKATTNRLAATGLIFSLVLCGLAVAPTLAAALVLFFVLGAASVAFRALATSLLQLRAEPEMRGRVVSLLIMATTGTTPFGGPLVGWISELHGVRWALALGGTSTAVAAVAAFIYMRRGTPDEAARPKVAVLLPDEIAL